MSPPTQPKIQSNPKTLNIGRPIRKDSTIANSNKSMKSLEFNENTVAVDQFMESLVNVKKQNQLSYDQLVNYKYGFDFPKNISKELAKQVGLNKNNNCNVCYKYQY